MFVGPTSSVLSVLTKGAFGGFERGTKERERDKNIFRFESCGKLFFERCFALQIAVVINLQHFSMSFCSELL